ncbi:cytochrome c oxidase subunit 3 [Pseudomonas yamanorum]|uniref:cytochrome c oxidase subunit 3 n=1 Tax=Pseudomonas yamanorum TaxID=515393 RepID=UPI003F74D4EB
MMSQLPDFLCSDAARPATPRKAQVIDDGCPGEAGIWVFIFGDMMIFGALFLVFLWDNRQDRAAFSNSAASLFQSIGGINTFILLLSSYLVVLAVNAQRRGNTLLARRLISGALVCALAFACLKAIEYSIEITNGHTPTSSLFFTFYFVLTGLHLLHVLIGVCLLSIWRRKCQHPSSWPADRAFVETCAVYWHMVDLLWIILYTLLYLVCIV